MPVAAPFPKIELHVHLEGTVRLPALLEITRRNGVDLGVTDEAAVVAATAVPGRRPRPPRAAVGRPDRPRVVVHRGDGGSVP